MLRANGVQRSVDSGARSDPSDKALQMEGRPVIRFECPEHGVAGFNLPGTRVHCRWCGQQLFAPIADLIFSDLDEIEPLS